LQSGNSFIGDFTKYQIVELKNRYSSPMIIDTKVMIGIFRKSELVAKKRTQNKQLLDANRMNNIQSLVNIYFNCFDEEKQAKIWKSYRIAISRLTRKIEIKDSKLIN